MNTANIEVNIEIPVGYEQLGAEHLPAFEGDEDPEAAVKIIDSLEHDLRIWIIFRNSALESRIAYHKRGADYPDEERLMWSRIEQNDSRARSAKKDVIRICEVLDRFVPLKSSAQVQADTDESVRYKWINWFDGVKHQLEGVDGHDEVFIKT